MDFLNGSFRVARLFGINVRVHVLFVLFAAFWLWQGRADVAWTGGFLAMLFGIVLVHEFGHCFGARSVGGNAENILIWPLGGLAYPHAPMTPWAQFVTVASGPLVNVGFCLASGVVLVLMAGTIGVLSPNPFASINFKAFAPGTPSWVWYVSIFYSVNYFLLALNLLPVYPLDGGQLFQCVLWPFMGLQRAMTIACQVGIIGCIGLGLWGLTKGGGGMLIFIALFGGFTCWQRLKMLKYGMIVDDRIKYAPYREYKPRRGGFFRRIFSWRLRPSVSPPASRPKRGAWQAKTDDRAKREAELDRILKKVREQGLHSLNYVERQALERATRERQQREREADRKTRV